MKEPGLDGRHRDKNPPKAGEIQQKRSDTLNKNLPKPIPQFPSNMTLGKMREKTGKVSEADVRRAAAKKGKSPSAYFSLPPLVGEPALLACALLICASTMATLHSIRLCAAFRSIYDRVFDESHRSTLVLVAELPSSTIHFFDR